MIKELLKNNLKMKLLSMLFAFFMWIFVMAEVDPIINRTIDNVAISTITNQTEVEDLGFVVSPESHITTQVSVRGRRSLVNAYVTKGPVVTGTVKNPQLGVNQVDLIIQPKDNVELTINPIRTEVKLEEMQSSRKIITTRLLGETAENYEVNNIVLNPDSTLVEGPESLVTQVNEIIATIDIADASKDFIQNVKLNAIDIHGNEVKDVKLQVRYVEATINIHKAKIVPIELVVVDNGEEVKVKNYYIDTKEIQIKGEEGILEQITSIKTQPIYLEQLRNIDDLTVSLELPEGIRSNIISGKVKSNTDAAHTLNLEYLKSDIVMDGFTEAEMESMISIIPEKIRLSITYDSSLAAMVKDEEIKIFVDKEKSNVELNRYYFAVESKIPYIKATITPNVVNKIN